MNDNRLITPWEDIKLSDLLKRYNLDRLVTAQQVLDSKPLAGAVVAGQPAQGRTTPTNWELIQRRYSDEEADANVGLYPTGEVLIKAGTSLFLWNAYLNRTLIKDESRKLKERLFKPAQLKPFLAARLRELLQDPRYISVFKSTDQLSQLTVENTEVTVYVWSRALAGNSVVGGWLNLSGEVQSVETRTGAVGTFSLVLPAIDGTYVAGSWRTTATKESYQGAAIQPDVLSTQSIVQPDQQTGLLQRAPSYFAAVLQKNDLIYIRFERLASDVQAGFTPDAGDVVGRTWDMIGLIDQVTEATTPTQGVVTVTGRDLMKVLVDDGSVFFPEQFAQNLFTDENSLLTFRNRYYLDEQSVAGASYSFKTIETILKFTFNKFSSMGYVPSSVFDVYGEQSIRQKYRLQDSELSRPSDNVILDELNTRLLRQQREGVWRICDLIVDPGANRVLADNSICQDSGSIINSIRKFCQEPFVEFQGDTYGDRYVFTVRKQPFDAQGVRGMVYGSVITDRIGDGVNHTTATVGTDRALEAKIARNATARLAATGTRPAALSDLVIDIAGKDVLGEPQFTYHQEAYSWYRLIPRGLGVLNELASFLFAPIVPFDEYAKVWGNQTLMMEYNYSPAEYLSDAADQDRQGYIESQTIYDLQFLVQSNAYLPFTRQGPITLTGDRTFKKGMYVYYEPTKEVFYVDGVRQFRSKGNSAQENVRLTTLYLTRGMREPFIKGVNVLFPGGPKRVSYFDIIPTPITNDASISNQAFLKNWRVDLNVFNFFLQRRQWA